MDLLGHKMLRDGIRTVGTIERIATRGQATMIGAGQYAQVGVFITCAFTDQQGAAHVVDKRAAFTVDLVPVPGSEIEVRYMPDDPQTWDYYSIGLPDPSVPRGWGAGIFEVPAPVKHHHLWPAPDGAIDRQRELFRSGRPEPAQVIAATCLDVTTERNGSHEYSLTLRPAGGRDVQAQFWAPPHGVPLPGDVILIVVSADGSEVALDSDERYDGAPGQALVFTTPPEVAAQRPPRFSVADYVNDSESKMAAIQARNQAALARMQAGVAAMAAGQLPASPTPPAAAEPDRSAELQRLAALQQSGALTAAEYAAMQAKIMQG